MKRWLIVGMIAALVIGVFYLRQAQAVQIDFLWDYDYSVDPACTVTLTSNCVEGFELSDANGVLQTIPNPANPTGFVSGISTTVVKGPPYGNQTFSLVAVGLDSSGAVVESVPATVDAVIRPGRPQNIRFP